MYGAPGRGRPRRPRGRGGASGASRQPPPRRGPVHVEPAPVQHELDDRRSGRARAPSAARPRTRRPSRRGRPRAPHARAAAAKSSGPRSVAGRRGAPRPVLVVADHPVPLVVEHDRDDVGPLPDRRLHLRQRHAHAAVADERDDRAARGGRARPRAPPASRSPSRPTSGPRNVPGRRNRKPRAAQPPKAPASVVTIASSGSRRRSVVTIRPGMHARPRSTRPRRRPMAASHAARSAALWRSRAGDRLGDEHAPP